MSVFAWLFAHVIRYRSQHFAGWCFGGITLSICFLLVVALEFLPVSLSERILLWKLRITFGLLLTPLFFLSILRYLRRGRIRPSEWIVVLLIPATTITLCWLMSPLYRSGFFLDDSHAPPVLRYEAGPWVWIQSAYHFVLGLAFVFLLVRLLRESVKWAPAAWVILLFCTLPGIMDTAYVLRVTSSNLAWMGFAPAGLAILFALSKLRMSKLAPVSRTALMEQTDTMILVIDAEGNVVDMNSAAGRAFQISPDKAMGRKAVSFLPDPEAFGDLLAKTGRETAEISLDGTNGSALLECKMIPVWNTGEICARILSMENITARKEASERLHRAVAAAEEASAAKSRFLAAMSHEIRTPLNSILGYSQVLSRRSDIPNDASPALAAIQESGDHLLRLLEGVLDMSKIEAGCMDLVETDFDLGGVLDDMEKIFSQICGEHGLAFGRELPPSHRGLWVHGDGTKLRQVLLNLLGNAVKFTKSGEVRLRVKVLSGGAYRFEVCDTGPGLTPEEQAAIFAPFGQTAEGSKMGGTGLGIPISAKLLEIMGSRLELDSSAGEGSRFCFSLRLPSVLASGIQEKDVNLHLASGCKVRALVADDDKASRDVLEIMLRETGCEVCTALDGEGASTLLDSGFLHIAFIDAHMPGASGVEVVSRHRSEGPKRTRFVCYSASVFRHEWNLYSSAGYDSLLSKPCHYHDIYQELEKIPEVRLEPADAQREAPPSTIPLTMPEAVAAQLLEAVELGDFARIREILAAQAAVDALPAELIRHIRHHAGRFDREALRSTIASAVCGTIK